MVRQGLFDRFPCESVFALHNWPDLPAGTAATRPGPIMAAADRFDIVVRGRGGHAAQPDRTPDVVLAASQLVAQMHTIVSRRIPPTQNAVLSVTRISGGQSHNVLPAAVELTGTVRSFDPAVQDAIEQAVRDVAAGVARASGTTIDVEYTRYYPATVNSPEQAQLALEAARSAGLEAQVAAAPAFTSEDFAFMLQQRPGLTCGSASKAQTMRPRCTTPRTTSTTTFWRAACVGSSPSRKWPCVERDPRQEMKPTMLYLSTRGHPDRKHFCEILLEGLAPDGGLYLPEQYPQVTPEQLSKWRGLPYAELAFEVLSLYIDDIPAEDLRAICRKTYTEEVFGTKEIVPLKKLEDGAVPRSPVQRPHAGLQGHGDAVAGQPVRVRAGAPRRGAEHPGRHLGRHRQRRRIRDARQEGRARVHDCRRTAA